jgi:hypothetical protein
MEHQHTNRLSLSTSPYLLQHAHNPVDWYEWGEEALEKARKEDKPLLVSIGYSSCHWCHVMERESFENDAIAAIMNQHFVCIKVDREERPDIDQIYMEAVQAMQQNGGWPLNVFLTPDQKPFWGGTYFPPQSWAQVLQQLSKVYKERRKDIDDSGEELRKHLQTSDGQRFARDPAHAAFTVAHLNNMAALIEKRFDQTYGGMDKAPKFIMPSIWLFLLRHYHLTGRTESLKMVTTTLQQISQGGIYDQLGGGFSRYSVDGKWFAPHFEKMLYDNGQLLSLYAEAYSITGNRDFATTFRETATWLDREMSHPEGGFYSALDADSEGEEGLFYTWTWEELNHVLSSGDVTREYYNATPEGNWEHGRNILFRSGNESPFMSDYNINKHDLDILVTEGRKKLLAARDGRIRPGLDDKVLVGWNAMTIQGLLDGYRMIGDPSFLDRAIRCMAFLEKNLMSGGRVFRAYKNHHSKTEAFLEDYAFLIQAYVSLYEATFDEHWIRRAEHWCDYVIEHFYDPADGYFFYSSSAAEPLLARKKEIFDNVIPSSNAVMARNLHRLGTLLDNEGWINLARTMVARLISTIESEPSYLCHWGIAVSEFFSGLSETVIVGRQVEVYRSMLHRKYLPFTCWLGSEKNGSLPLFQGRESKDEKTWVYVCKDKACQLPVDSPEAALTQLRPV